MDTTAAVTSPSAAPAEAAAPVSTPSSKSDSVARQQSRLAGFFHAIPKAEMKARNEQVLRDMKEAAAAAGPSSQSASVRMQTAVSKSAVRVRRHRNRQQQAALAALQREIDYLRQQNSSVKLIVCDNRNPNTGENGKDA